MKYSRLWSLGALLSILFSGMIVLGCPSDTVTTGAVIVQILPTTAVQAGAQWRVDAGDWHDHGDIVDELEAGTHVITFKTVSGWLTPPQQSVLIQSGSTSAATGKYSFSLTQAVTRFASSAVDAEDAGEDLFASFVRTTDLSDRGTARTQLHDAIAAYLAGGGTLATLQQRSDVLSTRFYSDAEVGDRYSSKKGGKHPDYDDWEALEAANIVVFVNGMNVGLPGFIEDSFALEDAIDSLGDSQDLAFLALWIPGFTPNLATLTAGDQTLLQWIANLPSGSGYSTVLQDVAEHLLLLQASGHNVILVSYSAGNLPVLNALNNMTTERASFSVIETGSNAGTWPSGIIAHSRIDIANDPVAQLSAQYGAGNTLVRNSSWTIQDSLFYVVAKDLSTWSDTGALATL